MGAKRQAKFLAYDLGGTKVAVGVVDARGRILTRHREPARFPDGKEAVLEQLVSLGRGMLRQFPDIQRGGVASAGPLDPGRGLLLDPTNFASRTGKRWGTVSLAAILTRKLRIPVAIENDAAAAVLAEHWVGATRRVRNSMILTLGTGLGTGIICNGSLVRAGRGLHPEAGHLILNPGDRSAPCGCGNFGCAEAYLSGRNFTHRARKQLGETGVTAAEYALRARKERRVRKLFEEHGHWLALAIHNYVVAFAPEIVVLTGSFAEASPLFLPTARKELLGLLRGRRKGVDMLPKIVRSALDNDAGLIGGAYVALRHSEKRP